MKILKTIVLTIIFAVAVAFPALADTTVKSIVFKLDTPYYVVNGQTPGTKISSDINDFRNSKSLYFEDIYTKWKPLYNEDFHFLS